jgi:hypothetical protein
MKSTVGYLFLVMALLTVLSKNHVSAEMDPAGNIIASPEATTLTLSIIGDVINSFPNPSALRGLTFKDGRLWGITSAGFGGTGSGVLYEMNADTGAIISTHTISPMPSLSFGLGFDAARNVFIVADPSDDTILKVDPDTGVVLDSFPSPHAGPVGAAYDATRDGYWISDFSTNAIDLVNPTTGVVVTTCPVPSGASRIAGTGYNAVEDIILFNSRDNATSYMIKGTDCSLVASFPTPPSPGMNNGQGAAVRPSDRTGYLTNFEVPTIFVVNLGLTVAEVTIDIKPSSDPNSINCTTEDEVISVAILTTDHFDATMVDHTTVTFEAASETHVDRRSGEPRRHEEDVDGDGDIDLVFHFRLGETDLDCDSTEGILTGETFDGQSVEGTDSVNMIGS